MTVRVLGVDTSGPVSGVALIDDEQVVASCTLRRLPASSPQLLSLIDLVCRQAGWELSGLAGLAINLGPGAFTALRMGLATMQGLAMACGKPLVGCSAFEVLAALVQEWHGILCPVLEARRGEVYAALYRRQGMAIEEVQPGMVLTPEALCTYITERTLFVGNGVHSYGALFAAALGSQAVCVAMGSENENAVSVARLGRERLGRESSAAPSPLTPLYIRAADARLPQYLTAASATAAAFSQRERISA